MAKASPFNCHPVSRSAAGSFCARTMGKTRERTRETLDLDQRCRANRDRQTKLPGKRARQCPGPAAAGGPAQATRVAAPKNDLHDPPERMSAGDDRTQPGGANAIKEWDAAFKDESSRC